jgi:hypothetical protein
LARRANSQPVIAASALATDWNEAQIDPELFAHLTTIAGSEPASLPSP